MANRTRSRFHSGGSRAPARLTEWTGTSEAGVAFQNVASNTKVIALQFSAASFLDLVPCTIVRTRIDILWETDQISAGEIQIGALGAAVVSDVANQAGAASIPGPISDPTFAGWFVFQPLQNRFNFQTGVGFESVAGKQYTIDSKAMRKVKIEEAVVIMVETAASSDGARFALNVRMLLKLH